MKSKRSSSVKPFSRLTVAEKRVAIAKDVIYQIHQRTTAKQGSYWEVSLLGESCRVDNQNLKRNVRCTVCAVGAAVISGIRLFNETSVDWINGNDEEEVIAAGRKWFSPKQLALIEAAFEEGDESFLVAKYLGITPSQRAIAFNEVIEFDSIRAIIIFENIIKNVGTFKP